MGSPERVGHILARYGWWEVTVNDYAATQAKLAEWHERAYNFVCAAIGNRRPPRDDWWEALHDTVHDIDEVASRGNHHHPDDVASAHRAMSSLAGIWLDTDELEQQLYAQPPSSTADVSEQPPAVSTG